MTRPLRCHQARQGHQRLHYCGKNLVESDRTFGFSVDDAIARNCDAAVITGDSTDHALDAHEPALHTLAKQHKRLADHCPVLMLQGTFSHEPVGLLRMFQMIGAKYPIFVVDKIGAYGLTDAGFENFTSGVDYKLVITAFPTVNKAELMDSKSSKEAGVAMGELLYQMMQQFGVMNHALRLHSIPTMLIGHGTVDSCKTEHGVPMAGQDHEFGVGALFAAQTDAVALGHIHKHQSWDRAENGRVQRIAYPGSIGRFHYGEDGDKNYLMWSIVSGDSPFEAIATPSRRTIDLFFDGPPDMAAIREAAAGCAGAFVRVRYSVDEESRQLIDRGAIKAALSGCADIQIEGKTLAVERTRAAGVSTTPSMEAKFKQRCGLTATKFEPLQQPLSDLMHLDAAQITKITLDKINETPKTNHDASHHFSDVDASVGNLDATDQSVVTDVAIKRSNAPAGSGDTIGLQRADSLFS